MKRFKNILYVSERAVTEDTAIARAASLARNNQARLIIVDVIPEPRAWDGMSSGDSISAKLTAVMIAERRQMLESLVAPYTTLLDFDIEVLVGIKFLEVIRSVLRNDYDLVIKPAEDPDWIERLFGSDDMHLLRKCPCPVWLMKPKEKPNYACILAAVDFDLDDTDPGEHALNQQILTLASSLALSDFAQLHLVHVWDAPIGFASLSTDNRQIPEAKNIQNEHTSHVSGMNTLTQRLRKQVGAETYKYLSPKVHLSIGLAQRVIPTLAKDLNADLVVMGTVARTGIPGFIIGNTAEAIFDQLQCSVLAVKPPDFISPVRLD